MSNLQKENKPDAKVRENINLCHSARTVSSVGKAEGSGYVKEIAF